MSANHLFLDIGKSDIRKSSFEEIGIYRCSAAQLLQSSGQHIKPFYCV